mmetsp:Transcript_64033/g.187351  ORF Transcript_64033/g.187351 Transcript_64033/m.187351 type:complete len:663 (-) Transcript_64033:163-2151(-)
MGETVPQAPLKGTSGHLRHVLWRLCGGVVDAFTICVSVADIVTDILVLLEFKQLGYDGFFLISLAIFALAQCAYAFLFTATFAGHRAPMMRCIVFLAALPFGQLVPLFTWLEVLRFPAVDRSLRSVGLKPTRDDTTKLDSDTGDSLWGFLQSKYQSHAGFLVEAFVEAVPQAVLQTIFVILANHGSALNAASVGISIFTVASKGYLVSYALDYITFLFNFGCIVADCLGLFATVTTIAMHGFQGFLASAIAAVSVSGLVLSVGAGHALLWFTIADDHLKLRNRLSWPDGIRGISSVFFDLYIVRLVAWFLAIVPCVVLFAGARLSIIPVCVLRSVDPDLVRHARFFRCIVHFLSGEGGGSRDRRLRLWTVNAFIARARQESDRLEQMLLQRPCSRRPGVIVSQWAGQVGIPKAAPMRGRPQGHSAQKNTENTGGMEADAALQQAILESLSKMPGSRSGFAGMATLAFRRTRAMTWLEAKFRMILRELQVRSEIFRPGCLQRSRAELSRRPSSAVLRGIAMVSLAMILLCALPLLLGHVALIVVSTIFPLLHMVSNCAAPSIVSCPSLGSGMCAADGMKAQAVLPCALSAAYCAILAFMAVLAPVVARKQLVWVDLVDLHGFPDPFYGGAVLVEIRKRHLRDTMLRDRLGHYLAEHVTSYLER